MMPEIQHTRTTRQAAVGRFRRNRLARRDMDLAERQSLLLRVAERLVVIMDETHTFLADTRERRLKEEQALRKELAGFHLNLSKDTISTLLQVRDARAHQAETDRSTRADYLRKLRDDVVHIVSEDFL